ncbi:heterokaryon incompatibility protein-domain-containing protein [Xylaria palmicola]|nr:heterokaryon incompatibility protein-domain-containing protein [Xylaria palmicola]
MLSLFQRFGLGTRKDGYPGAPIKKSTSIRVLKLKGIQGDRIDCKLKTVSLAALEGIAYDALSYRWGDVADPKLIYCNRVPFNVQRSLFQALFRIWSRDPALVIWVDAICINQNNVAELASQVKIMGTIYQLARRVIIWLGEADEFTDMAWRALLEASPATHESTVDGLEARLAGMADPEDLWLSLHNLGQREWFYRAWTFQELYLARCATVLCSEYEMDWDRFHRALDRLAALLDAAAASMYSVKARHTLRRLLASVEKLGVSDGAFTLTDLLSRTIHRSCNEPKDKIYALLGVLFREESLLERAGDVLPIDYTINPELVYTQVSRALVTRAPWTEPGRTRSEPLDLGILHAAGLDAHNRRYRTTWFKGLQVNRMPGALPTWVADWTDHEAALLWTEQTALMRHRWRPVIDTDGIKLGAAVDPQPDAGRAGRRELPLCGVALARLVRVPAAAADDNNDRLQFDLEELPRCATYRSLLSQVSPSASSSSNGMPPHVRWRWTAGVPAEEQARYPSDDPSRTHHAPRVLHALAHHDKKGCECFRAPFFHTIAASVVALVASLVLGRGAASYVFGLVCLVALRDCTVLAGRPSRRRFRLDVVATRQRPTAAGAGDWIVSLAGEQGLFLLKPTREGKFQLVRGLLRYEGVRPDFEVSRIDASGNKLVNGTPPGEHQQHHGGSNSAVPSWRDFRVLPISLSLV